MKKTKLWSIFLVWVTASSFFSCEINDPDGLWDPIKMDKKTVLINDKGGQDTIRLKNYSLWWLSDVNVRVNDTTVYRYPEYINDDSVFYTMNGDWYSIHIPQDNKQLLVVKCNENINHDYRELIIGVTVGDAFNSIRVVQSDTN